MNSKQLNSFVAIILFSTILFSCQNAGNKDEKYSTWQKMKFEKGTIYVSSQKMYSDSQIKLAGAFDEEMKTVSVAFNNHMQTSKSQPKDNEWEDTYSITQPTPDSQPLPMGKHKIAIVATPKDGSKSTTFETEIEIIGKPNVTFTYNRSDFKEQELTAKSDVKLLGITIKTPDGKLLPFKGDPTGLTFTLKYALPSPKDGKAVAIIQQEENLSFEMKLYMEDFSKKAYVLRNVFELSDVSKIIIVAKSQTNEDEYTFCELPIPDFRDDFIDSVVGKSVQKKLEKQRSFTKLLGISDNLEWVFIEFETFLNYISNENQIDSTSNLQLDDTDVYRIITNWYYICNTKTKNYTLINKPRSRIEYATGDGSQKIIGCRYLPVYWEDSELLMIEQSNNGKIKEYEDVYATTGRPVVFSFEDMALMETNKIKFWKPWVRASNLKTGITKYVDAIKYHERDYENTITEASFLSSIEGKTWDFGHIGKQIPKVLSVTWNLFRVDTASTFVNGKPFVVLTALYQWYKYVEPEGNIGPPKPLYKKAVFDFETGKVGKFLEGDEQDCWVPVDNDFESTDYPRFKFWNEREQKVRFGKIVGNKIEFEEKLYTSHFFGFLR